ncbi:MAG: Lrp/AsnC family transcriptional regulator [Candidatus Lokiarchaeota archaeon]|nr:Lrp/AsnC family transcriptional regulator [Candidatus Lokiarchaeota archaeon]
MSKKIDLIDLKILEELKSNSRISFNDISKKIDKTEATVRRRVKKLLDEGIIKRFTVEYNIDTKQKISATVKIIPDFKEVKRILRELSEVDEITNIWRLSGDCGLLLKVDIPSIEEFNPLIEDKISQIQGIKIIETCFITDIIK